MYFSAIKYQHEQKLKLLICLLVTDIALANKVYKLFCTYNYIYILNCRIEQTETKTLQFSYNKDTISITLIVTESEKNVFHPSLVYTTETSSTVISNLSKLEFDTDIF